ncbi:MAG: DinB family protein [Chloroflexi bacterium]|nr:DinB family protein [Chloroflexota bacterium]
MSHRSTELANQLEQAVAEFGKTIQGCSDEAWAAASDAEGWTVAQLAQHVAGQFPLEMEFITAAAEGNPLPPYTWDDINSRNDGRAGRNITAAKADVLRELGSNAAVTAAYLRALTDEQLDHAAPLGLADGAIVTTQQLIEGGVLIAHVTGHLECIRTAKVPTGARR